MNPAERSWIREEFNAFGHCQGMSVFRSGWSERQGGGGVLKARWGECANRQTYRAD